MSYFFALFLRKIHNEDLCNLYFVRIQHDKYKRREMDGGSDKHRRKKCVENFYSEDLKEN